MKRVLMIAYFFPPLTNSGTQRPLKFAKYLPQFGWQPIVLTVERPPDRQVDDGLIHELPADVEIHRVPMLSDRVGDIIASLALGIGKRRIADAVSWRLRRLCQQPDLYALWRGTATRAALRIFRQTGFDAIYATGFPWTSLLIGRDVCRSTGRPLVADFRDPWASEDLFRSGGSNSTKTALELSVIRQASAVVSVSRTMSDDMTTAYPAHASNFLTIPNGFDPDDLPASSAGRRVGGRFRIVYTGVWKAGYGLDVLYQAIIRIKQSDPELLAKLEVIAAGFEPGAAARMGLHDVIEEVGVVSHRHAIALMQTADVLFLANADGARQKLALPGKLFEYLASGRPVLAVTDPDGEAGRLVQRVGGGVVIAPNAANELQHMLKDALRKGELNVPGRNDSALRGYERPALARRLAEILNHIVGSEAQS